MKQPYEMTGEEFGEYLENLDSLTPEWQDYLGWCTEADDTGRIITEYSITYRRDVVIPQAIAEGKVIPPEVLKELGL